MTLMLMVPDPNDKEEGEEKLNLMIDRNGPDCSEPFLETGAIMSRFFHRCLDFLTCGCII